MLEGHMDLTIKAFKTLDWQWGAKVLDVGCGSLGYSRGFFLSHGFKWMGIDSRVDDEKNSIYKCNMEDMKIIPDDTMDIVFVCHSLEHSENPLQALREFRRVLRPGGYLFLSLPVHCEKQILGGDTDHIFVFSQWQLKRIMAYAKLYIIDLWIEKQTDCRDSVNTQIVLAIKPTEVKDGKPSFDTHSDTK